MNEEEMSSGEEEENISEEQNVKFTIKLDANGYTFEQAQEKAEQGGSDVNVFNVVSLNDDCEVDVEPRYAEPIKQLINNYKPLWRYLGCNEDEEEDDRDGESSEADEEQDGRV
ncbi:hypothetical protein ACLKA7_005066 [Drosophila subpalustris]